MVDMRKNWIKICLLSVLLIFSLSGCIEESNPVSVQPSITPTQSPITIPPQATIPTTQNINGNYKIQDVSGDVINLNGNYNEIRILNSDVSLIRVNGNYNIVYYPNEARPKIVENGYENKIKTSQQ